MRRLEAVPFAATLLLLAATRADAYLDPGSGSMLVQLLLGGAAGLAVLARLYWRKLLGLVGLHRAERRES